MTARTVFGVMATPFTTNDRVDETALRIHLRRMIDAGVGVYLGALPGGNGVIRQPYVLPPQ
jgi:dihydrodipicolinate synthase/N-acetylneuraminate lyase